MPITFTKVLSMYALLQASFQSFKVLRWFCLFFFTLLQLTPYADRIQQYSQLIDEHNRSRKKNPDITPLDDVAIFRAVDQKEILPLLHFWSVMAVIHLYDSYFEVFVEWVPFYSAIKLLLMLWILVPKTRGATVFFEVVLIPQVDKMTRRMEEKWFPLMRQVALNVAFIVFRLGVDPNLETVSQTELNSLNRTVDLLTRTVTREGYRRNREESIQTLRNAVPDEKQRIALLDDILREYDFQDELQGKWSEVRLEHDSNSRVRVRFASDFDSEEEDDWYAHGIVTPEDILVE